MKRRRRQYEETDEAMHLGDVLEPYQQQEWDAQSYQVYDQPYEPQDPYAQGFVDGYYGDEYSDEHEAADHESRFRIALGMFDFISIFIGIVVILVLVAMLITLFNWIRADLMHSALLLQSGLQ